jgi:cyclic pyranopterin phosphate synthase
MGEAALDPRPDPERLAAGPPREGPLIDTFGRVAADLRVSVTDRCNFRCRYCMPAEGLAWLPRSDVLTFEEITRLVDVFRSLGIRSVKLTGGEPTVRADLPRLVGMLRQTAPHLELSMTTNGILLERLANPLARAGLDRVSISCDSLLRHRFEEMARRDALERVLAGIRAADVAGLTPIKINVVVLGGMNDDEMIGFARFSRRTGHEVRFIEYMPLDADGAWERAGVVPSAEVIERISATWPLVPASEGPSPATSYAFADGAPGRIGVIPSVTEPFCDRCDRLRLTADGKLLACLFVLEEIDLRGPLRAGESDESLVRLIRDAVWKKWHGHRIGREDFVRPVRSMSMIGG